MPDVNTAAEAEAVVQHAKYAPRGHRGWSGWRAVLGEDAADYAAKALGSWAGFSVGWLYWYFWVIVVGFELVVLAWLRWRFFEDSFLRALGIVTFAGIIIASVSAGLGNVLG